MKFVKAAVIGAVLIAGAAFAEGDRTDPNAKARSDLMRIVGKNTGILGDMAGGKAAYDAAFKDQGAADPASEAKPEIWANWDEFLADAKKLGDAAGAMDVASAESIGAGMGALGGACKDCHTEFRVMKQ